MMNFYFSQVYEPTNLLRTQNVFIMPPFDIDLAMPPTMMQDCRHICVYCSHDYLWIIHLDGVKINSCDMWMRYGGLPELANPSEHNHYNHDQFSVNIRNSWKFL